jgi:hypothetical protein
VYGGAAFSVLGALSLCHLLNDMVQSLLPAIYPILKTALNLDFRHVGLITLVNQMTASLLQPLVGYYTDRRPKPQSLSVGMTFSLCGLILLGLRGWRPADSTASHSRYSRWGAMPAQRSALFSRLSSFYREVNGVWRGSLSSRSRPLFCCGVSGAGTAGAHARKPRREAVVMQLRMA